MHWHEWSEAAFDEARRRRCPVFLYLEASWCRFCRDLERDVLADARVEATLSAHFVAVRVDKDRRPDIDARYSKGGWPTLAYLDESGEMIASDAFLGAAELGERLDLVRGYYAENREAVRRRLSEAAERAPRGPTPSGELAGEIVDTAARMLVESADPVWGGWGARHKFPHPEALDFALIRWSETGDAALRKLVLRTLRHMQAGEIHDRVEGGFYRYATSPDWSGAHTEKVLDSNAQRLAIYLAAYQAFGEPTFLDAAQGILRWMGAALLDPATGAYRGSQDADPQYARLATIAARRERGAPACDPTVFANWNAMAVSALFSAGFVLERPEHERAALRTLDFLLEELWDERQGVYHYWDGAYHLPGMLTDQAYVLRALLDAAQATGRARYLDAARSLAHVAIESLRSPDGSFFDVRHDPLARGGLVRRERSLHENAVMAEALLRLALVAREDEWAEQARGALRAFASDYKRHGHWVASYARAVDFALRPPIFVTVVGDPARSEVRALQRAALAPFVASRIVQIVDPREQKQLLVKSGLADPGDGRPKAFVQRGRESYAETSDPGRLPALMARIERGG